MTVAAAKVVIAWTHLGSCEDEMGREYCGEYESALDDAIIGLKAVLTAPPPTAGQR